jgi:hypothetical protein
VTATTLQRPLVPRPPTSPDRLERMSPDERLRAYRSGVMTRAERTVWAANFPDEVPLINDEYEWLAADLESG